MSGLPEGWCETTVERLAQGISYGFTTSASSTPNGPKFLRITDIQKGKVDWNSVPFCKVPPPEASRFLLKSGDIVFARTGATTGKSFLIRFTPEAVFASYLIRLRPSGCFLPELMAYFFQSAAYWEQITENLSGSAQPNCNATKLSSLTVPVPPLNEQRRIVARLEELLSRVDSAQARLATIPFILKRFRQSVFAAACSGRLTVDWRQRNSISDDWTSAPLLEVSELIQIGPFGTQVHKADYKSNGIPLINPTHIQASRVVHDPAFSVSRTKLKELENYVLQKDDIIMGRRGEMGRCALISEKESGWLCGTGSLFVRPNSSVHPAFLFLILRNGETKAFLENESKGTTMSNLNLEILKRVPVSHPKLAEQKEIIRRVEALFKSADALEARYRNAKAHVDKLTQSILAKAFRGELVPQDPKDEPASALLARIRLKERP